MFNEDTTEEEVIEVEESTEDETEGEAEDTTDWKAEALQFKAILDRKKVKVKTETP